MRIPPYPDNRKDCIKPRNYFSCVVPH